MKIGFIGLGKLGLPVALAIESKGHDVVGWDISPEVEKTLTTKIMPYKEVGAQTLLGSSKIQFKYDFNDRDIVFMAIQTPHDPRFEGTERLSHERADFDYTYLIQAVKDFVRQQTSPTTLVLISTVLPGTIEREIKPLLSDKINFIYNPFFIAMGTVIPDFTNPEFVLIGRDRDKNITPLFDFYGTIHSRPLIQMPIRDAELTKVAYNTFIGMKIVFANTMMEICHKNGGNVDNVIDALKQATDRIISPKYLNAGMGDGGGCHPRDNIAMSYIARKLNLSHNFFDDLMLAREHQTEFLAQIIQQTAYDKELPIFLIGKSFKPETNIQTGSPAILLANILRERGGVDFTHVEEGHEFESTKGVYFVATKHEVLKSIAQKLPTGSIVIDPFGYVTKFDNGVDIIHIGRN